jgi:hypothetical protein
MGVTDHYWYRAPDDQLWLFKPVVETSVGVQGEDWSEKVASAIANVLGVPAAQVELATRDGVRGCISRDLKPSGWQLQPGSVLLTSVVPDYLARARYRTGHSAANIASALRGSSSPSGFVEPGFTAFDVFVGYLLFDALIANQDRHEENWAVLVPDVSSHTPEELCGSFDHASSLGFNLTDRERLSRLTQRGMDDWARKGRARRFERDPGSAPLSLVEYALNAGQFASRGTLKYWLERVGDFQVADVSDIVGTVPGLSVPTATFILEVVTINRGRLLSDGFPRRDLT